ncbi:hypothetical protein ACGO3R_08390 [Lactococcus lactis]
MNYLLKLAILLELTDFAYGNSKFKGFLERINLKYSQTDKYSNDELIEEIKEHIRDDFNKDDIEQLLKESGIPSSIVF